MDRVLSEVFNLGVKAGAGEPILPEREEGILIISPPSSTDVSTFNPSGLPSDLPLVIPLKSDLDPELADPENRLCRETTLSMIDPLPLE